jgi:beta-lactamase regulating signal transducer with metallopeptidase domain
MLLVWFAETTVVAIVLAAMVLLCGRWLRLGPVATHALWLVVLVKLVTPPIVSWPWSSRLMLPAAEVAALPSGPDLVFAEVRRFPVPGSGAGTPGGPIASRSLVGAHLLPDLVLIGHRVVEVWLVASTALALWQIGRVVRFQRRLRWAVPAPRWLVDEAERIGRRLGVQAPEILVIPGPATPMLWFLGRTKLLVPGRLVEALGTAGWQGILAHELAHVRRRDHWVRRLELAAGVLWWWNPLYWLTRQRLDAEAELACDEWAVLAFPEGRLAYAEALLEVCQTLSTAEPRLPALGVATAGRILERRVKMILRDQTPRRVSTPALIGAGLLALLAIPGWIVAGPSSPGSSPNTATIVSDDNKVDTRTEVAEEIADDDTERSTDRPRRETPTRPRRLRAARKKDSPDSLSADTVEGRGERFARDRSVRPSADSKPETSQNLLRQDADQSADRPRSETTSRRNRTRSTEGNGDLVSPSADAVDLKNQRRSRERSEHPSADSKPETSQNLLRQDAEQSADRRRSETPSRTIRSRAMERRGGPDSPSADAIDSKDERPFTNGGEQSDPRNKPQADRHKLDAGPDHQNEAAPNRTTKERPTRSGRIREMRALIEQLQEELNRLENEDNNSDGQ